MHRYPDLAAHLKLSQSFLDNLSYTQWEAWLAVRHKKKLFLVPGFAADDARASESQFAHLQSLKTQGYYPSENLRFTSEDSMIIGLLKALHDFMPPPAHPQCIADTRLVSRHTAADFIGRADELKLLDDAWAERDKVNVQCVIAWGGVGKTALLAHWVQTRFRDRGWQDALGQPEPLAYFDWTFYDQGTRADDATHAGAASIGLFFVEALKHFGDPAPEKPDDKARRLASLVRAQRSLLVLDGLEPLQYPHNHPQAGQITDPDLAQFLRLLAQRNPGLCLVSSREALSELGGQLASNAPHHDLEDLPTAAAVALLRKLGVIGSNADLAKAAVEYQHHALSLILLGRFLAVARGGDIRQRDTVSFEKADSNRSAQTRSAWRVLETYEQWLQSPQGNLADLQALRLIGLFERPASADCLAALRQAPAIPGLTEQLVSLDRDDWNAVLLRLHEAHLIQLKFPTRDEGSQAPFPQPCSVPVDAHPLVREYFAKRLRESELKGFEAAHSRLFDHLCESTEHWPDTLEGLQPLYQAVIHGCLAGRQPEALEKVYIDRILRGTGSEGSYSTAKLGAIGADLGAVAAFFEQPWSRLSPNLSAADQAWLLNQAACILRALGRLSEALEPMRVSGKMVVKNENWNNAAAGASNLSEMEVTLGQLGLAVADARRAIDFAERSGAAFLRMAFRATAADALYQSGQPGQLAEARALYAAAEALQREREPESALLYSLRGFQYCDLILACAERAAWQRQKSESTSSASEIESALAEAERRATQTLEWAKPENWLLDIALDHLTLARVALYRAALTAQAPAATNANPHLAPALDGLRKAGQADELPKALLTAAHWHALIDDRETALHHLDEAQQIAERGPMPLHLADVHLHRARLFCDKSELAKARVLIEKHGYWRRREELADAETASVQW